MGNTSTPWPTVYLRVQYRNKYLVTRLLPILKLTPSTLTQVFNPKIINLATLTQVTPTLAMLTQVVNLTTGMLTQVINPTLVTLTLVFHPKITNRTLAMLTQGFNLSRR